MKRIRSRVFRVVGVVTALCGVCGLAPGTPLWGHGEKDLDHVDEDRYWAVLAQDLPREVVDPASLRVASPEERQQLGEWSSVIAWPHIPVSAANLPDGRVLTWASWTDDDFGGGPAETVAHVWDPVSGSFSDVFNDFHDMFCAGVAILEDGRVVASGGGSTVRTTSTFDFESDSWTRHEDMNKSRWYNTSLSTLR